MILKANLDFAQVNANTSKMFSQVTKTQANRQSKKKTSTSVGAAMFRGINTVPATDHNLSSRFKAATGPLPDTTSTDSFPSLAPAPVVTFTNRPLITPTPIIYGPLGKGGPTRPGRARAVPVSTAAAPVVQTAAAASAVQTTAAAPVVQTTAAAPIVQTASAAPDVQRAVAPLPLTCPQCIGGGEHICPVKTPHDDRLFDFDDPHLPFIIKETQERVQRAIDAGRSPNPFDTERLDTFYTKHWFNKLPSSAAQGIQPSAAQGVQSSASQGIQPSAAKGTQPSASQGIQPSAAKETQPLASKRIQPSAAQPSTSQGIQPSSTAKEIQSSAAQGDSANN